MCFASAEGTAEGAADRSVTMAKRTAKDFFVKVWFVVVKGTSANPIPFGVSCARVFALSPW